jgi:hypothetical protein
VLVAGVLAYDVLCPNGELLSQSVDRSLVRRPWLTRLAVVYVAAHLLNVVPQKLDPLHRLSTIFGR